MPGRPNVLVLMSDQHRPDVLGCAGDPVVRTPHIDRLAAEGLRFERAYCQGPLCMPARASLLTERYVRDHGVEQNNAEPDPDAPTFLHKLQEAGYHTACVGKMHLWQHGGRRHAHTSERAESLRRWGIAEPIETVGKLASVGIGSEYSDALDAAGSLRDYRQWVGRHRYNGQAPVWDAESVPVPPSLYIDRWHGERAARWIEQYDREEPFFLQVGFPGPHDPWDAPEPDKAAYPLADMPMPGSLRPPDTPGVTGFDAFIEFFRDRFSDSPNLTDDRIRAVRRAYYADVSVIDEAVGRIRGALDAKGMLDDTWIVYTADHGEMMGEHRMLMKMVFYEPSVRVPLIVRPPGGQAPGVRDDLVEHVDLSATVRAIAGAGGDDRFEGRSLLDGPRRSVVRSQNYGFAMFRTERHKLVVVEDSLEPAQLFDLGDDPLEDRNLVHDPAARVVLERMLDEHARPFLAQATPRPGRRRRFV